MRWLGPFLAGCVALAVLQLAVPVLMLVVGALVLILALKAPAEALAIIFLFVLVGAVTTSPLVGFVLLALIGLGFLANR